MGKREAPALRRSNSWHHLGMPLRDGLSPSEVLTFRQLYPPLEPGELLRGTQDLRFAEAWKMASATSFQAVAGHGRGRDATAA